MFRQICTLLLAALTALGGLVAATAQEAKKAGTKNQPKRWAVLIGVDDYTELGKLRFAGDDQRALAEQLVAAGFPQDQVYVLHDKAQQNRYRPFRENIEKQLQLVLGMADKGDLVIVGFSGHGVQLEGKSYFCPVDARLEKLEATSIALDEVYDRLAKSKAALKLLLVDACRNDLVPAGRRSVALARGLGEFAASKERPPEGIMLLASCGPGQVSMEDAKFGHGVFMHFLLEGLRGQAADQDGGVTLAGLYNFASLQTKKYVAREFNDFQTPALRGDISGPFEICTRALAKQVVNSIGMKLVLIPPGEFMMGSGESAEAMTAFFNGKHSSDLKAEIYQDEHPQHRVRITRPFYLGAHHVTVGQFRRFVEEDGYQTDAEKDGKGGYAVDDKGQWQQKPEYTWRNPGFPQTGEHPVVNVSWNDAAAFCQWLSRKEGKSYRLPTEAEWEYACRAGTTTRYCCGDDPEGLAEVANVADATAKAKFPNWKDTIRASDGYVFTSPVGSFRPNAFGLYDMHGNAWQWCADWYDNDYYAASPLDDPKGPDSGAIRVGRGGCWRHPAGYCRSAARSGDAPGFRSIILGFRASLVPADR